jgi:hypothetical protein
MNIFPCHRVGSGGQRVVGSGAFPAEIASALSTGEFLKDGLEVLLGMRPEDIHDRLFQSGVRDRRQQRDRHGSTDRTRGRRNPCASGSGGTRFIARVRPDNPLEMNQPMELVFDLEKINLFSKDGKERYSLEGEVPSIPG